MRLRGQRNVRGDAGYAMAALLVAISVMAVLLTAVMPVWKQMAQREKEQELVFRGQQYVHAIQLYQRRAGPGTYPPSIDFLVQQKYLRKKYKDPITNADFVPVPAVAQTIAGAPIGAPAATGSTTAGRGGAAPPAPASQGLTLPSTTTGVGGTVPGGVAGVVSKSTDKSIRIYNGQTHYNEWVFRALAPTQPVGTAAPGQRGGQPGRGQTPAPGFGAPQRGGPQRGFPRGGPGGRGFPPGGPGRFGPNGPNGAQPNTTIMQGGRGYTILPNGQVVPVNPQGQPGR